MVAQCVADAANWSRGNTPPRNCRIKSFVLPIPKAPVRRVVFLMQCVDSAEFSAAKVFAGIRCLGCGVEVIKVDLMLFFAVWWNPSPYHHSRASHMSEYPPR